MKFLLLLPFCLQALAIGLDEIHFHLKRGLPFWERVGHPVDTLSFLLCLCAGLFMPYNDFNLKVYVGLSLFSCLMVTKDEFVHTHHCEGAENWLHALLFILHPLTLASAGMMWPVIQGVALPEWYRDLFFEKEQLSQFLQFQIAAIALFGLYQVIFWNFVWKGEVYEKHDQ